MRIRAVAAAILAVLFGYIATVYADPTKIRIGWAVVPSSLTPILFTPPGLARHLDKSYSLDLIHFIGTAPQVTALAANDVDIADMSFAAFGAAIENAHIDDLKIINDGVEDGVGGHENNEFLVLKDAPIATIEDLKGKVTATNTIGGAMDMGIRAMLRQHGLLDKRDYSVIEADFGTMKSLLEQKKADLISGVPPFSLNAELRAESRRLFTLKDAFGPVQLIFAVARQGFLTKNRAAVVDFLEDEFRAIRWYIDPANHTQAIAFTAAFMKLPPAAIDWAFTEKDNYRDPSGVPNLAALQSNLDTQKQLGFLKTDIDVKRHADLSLVEEAVKRLN
ncbi:MAG TPA: ABC transporter substrate-binding protein [Stellaceae bacterium]